MKRKGYRGVEYDVQQQNDGQWKWTVYPKTVEGKSFGESVDGTDHEAVAACEAAIDAWLAKK